MLRRSRSIPGSRWQSIGYGPCVTESAVWSTWTGVLALEDQPGADGRSIAPDALTWPMMPVPLFRMDGNESEYVGTITRISRRDGRLEASGRIGGYPPGAVLAVHMHIDAQGVRPKDRGTDPRRIDGGAIVGARLADLATWPEAVIVVDAAAPAPPAPPAPPAEPAASGLGPTLRLRPPIRTARLRLRPVDGAAALGADGQSLTLGIELASGGALIGEVVVSWPSSDHGSGEISCAIDPEAMGQGYATEACAAVVGLAFDPDGGLGLHRVVTRMHGGNTAAARLAERLGLRQEAHHRRAEHVDGQWADVLIYAVLAEEWATGGPAR